MANEKVDVVIVGAGASGSVYASVLAKAGKKVVLLESGPDWELSDLISSEIWGRRVKPAGAPIQLEGKNPMAYAAQGGWGVGGAALHYFANFPRLLPTDFRMKSEHGRGHDWPISYEDVAPFYDKVAREIGVSGDAKAEEKWRPAGEAYPMPPEDVPERQHLAQGLRSVGHPDGAGAGRHEFGGIQGTACMPV
jgi:choline dehydrogenase-like flavoprotein